MLQMGESFHSIFLKKYPTPCNLCEKVVHVFQFLNYVFCYFLIGFGVFVGIEFEKGDFFLEYMLSLFIRKYRIFDCQ